MNTYKLKELLTIKNGRDHKDLKDGDIPVYGSGGLMRHVDTAICNEESILLPRKGTLSNIQYVNTPFWTVDTIYYTEVNKSKANPFYLYNYLTMLDLSNLNSGTGVPSMTFSSYYEIEVKLPSLEEQNSIAKVLSNLNSKIQLNNQINQQLEEMAKTIYDYWFVQFDFPNEEGKPYKSSGGKMVYNKQLRREIPEGWEVKELSDIVEVSNETLNPMLTPDKEFRHYSIPVFDVTETYAVERGDEIRSNKFVVNGNDILVSKLNPWFNRVVYVEDEDDMISSTEFVVWRTDDIAMKNYLYMVARNEHFIETNVQAATGTSNSHRRVNPTLMMKYKVPFSSKQVHDFNAIIESSIKKIIELKKENQKLASLRDWLLPMLMNGQVTVE